MTEGKADPTQKSAEGEKKEKSTRLPFYEDEKNNVIFLTVRDSFNHYWFAVEECGQVVFYESLKMSALIVYPQRVPLANGMPTDIVTVPDKDLLESVPVMEASALFKEIKEHIYKYFDAPDLDIQMFVYYVFFTWFYRKSRVAPILRFLADLGSGKSRAVDVIGDLCFYRMKIDGGSTAASILRLKQSWHGTATADEADMKKSQDSSGYEETMSKFFNLGFEAGKYITKVSQENMHTQEVFDPFGPKVLGMRAPFRDQATESRCLSHSPRETTRKNIPNILPPEYFKEAAILRAKLARFTLHNWGKVNGTDYIDLSNIPIDGRMKQSALPLSFVVKQLFHEGEDQFLKYVRERYKEIQRYRAQSDEGIAFNTLRSLALGEITLDKNDEFANLYTGSKEEKIPARVTPKMMAAVYGWNSPQKITQILKNTLHFTIKNERVEKKVRRVILVDNEAWVSAMRRYYCPDDDQQQTFDDVGVPANLQMGVHATPPNQPAAAACVTPVTHVTPAGGEGVQ